MKTLVDAAVHSEQEKLIKCYFKPGSVERSIDLHREVCLSSCRQYFQDQLPMKIENFHSVIYFISYFDGIKDILESRFMIQLYLW
jgi:hypothetical protein